MRSLSHLAVCCAALTMSGCMQSMPTAEAITKPTQEAFARLSSWSPWRPAPQPEPVILRNDLPPPADAAALPPAAAKAAAVPDIAAPPSGSARTRMVTQAAPRSTRPRIIPVVEPGLVPAKLTCRAQGEPGSRVRMQCQAAE